MKKSLEDELMSLAHRVLQLRGSDDVHELKAMARELYEKLAILSFAEKHFEDPKPTIGCYDVEQALEEEQHENEATAVADGDEPESSASEKPDQPSEALEEEQPEERDDSPEEESEVIERVETEQPETTVEEQESAVEEVPIEETTEEIEVEESTEELEEEKQEEELEEETTSIENLEVNTPVSVDVEPEESEPVSEPTAEVATEDEGEENSENTESEKIIEESIEAEEPVATGIADSEPENGQEESEPEIELTDEMRNIAVHYDDLPDFEPIDFSMDEEEPKEAAEEPVPNSFDFEPAEVEEQPKPTPDLFSTAKKIRTRNDLKPSRKSLNERLNHGLKFGLNDRLAFANHLFNGDSADFDRVVSQLNTISTYPEAEAFIKEQIKPDYNWENEELYEERFLMAIEKRMED